jgi:GNAT superfamily N-acetyltransferase
LAHLTTEQNGYTISTDPARLDLVAVHAFLTRSYWAAGIPMDTVRRAAEHSLCFGIYRGDEQVGFARVVTDRSTFGYLADVYVLEAHRGVGLGKWLVQTILDHPDLQGVRRLMLVTRDAGPLYAQFGFETPAEPSGIMHIRWTNRYLGSSPSGSTSRADSHAAG